MDYDYTCEGIKFDRTTATTLNSGFRPDARTDYYGIWSRQLLENLQASDFPHGACIARNEGKQYLGQPVPQYPATIQAPTQDITRFEQTIFLTSFTLILIISGLIGWQILKLSRRR